MKPTIFTKLKVIIKRLLGKCVYGYVYLKNTIRKQRISPSSKPHRRKNIFNFIVLWTASKYLALLFVSPTETEIIKDTELFLHVAACFFPMLGLLSILRYSIQGVGYTLLAMLSGVSEMIARILVSVFAVPAYGYIAVCFGDPTAWIAACLFLVPAFIYVYNKLKKKSHYQTSQPTCVN